MNETYDDGLVQLDRAAITLRRYHFPSGTSKVIALDAIRGYKAEPLGIFMHRFRVWGSSDLRRWLPLDIGRPFKSTLITLERAGHPARPGLHAGAARRVHRPAGRIARPARLLTQPLRSVSACRAAL